jgi:tetratricopeptide (TPR) repeat protein
MRAAVRSAALFLFVAALTATGAFAQSIYDAQIREATALVDAGKADEAIAKLQHVLADEPANTNATYELGLAYAAKGDTKLCRKTLEPVGAAKGPLQVAALTTIANCLDNGHDAKGAIEMYRRALAIDPNDPEVAFNLGITLATSGSGDEARPLLERHAKADPLHASGHLILAKVFDAQHFTVPALFSYLHFIALEPTGARADAAVTRIRALMDGGAQKTAKGVNITIDPSASTAEGDYGAMAFMLPMAAAARGLEEKAKLSEFEQVRLQLVDDIHVFVETAKDGSDYTATTQVPFFTKMDDAKALDGFAAVVLISQKLPGMQEWAKAHERDVNTFLDWRRPLSRPAGVPMPPAP